MPYPARTAAATVVAVTLASGLGAAVAAAAPAHTAREGVAALRKQVDAGQVKAATFYSHARVIHASLAGGPRYSVHYTAKQRRALVSALLAHHVRFHILAGTGTAHGLRRRYVALIVVVALAALAAAGFGFTRWRRRGGAALR
jgi:hypothetical protein